MRETKEEIVERRSRNADAAFVGLFRAWDLLDWLWILAGALLLVAIFILWLLGKF
jgi:hypothetical protein